MKDINEIIKAAEAAVIEAERIHGWKSIQAADARSAYQAARYAGTGSFAQDEANRKWNEACERDNKRA